MNTANEKEAIKLYKEICKKVESINNSNLVKRKQTYSLDTINGYLCYENCSFKLHCDTFCLGLYHKLTRSALVSFRVDNHLEDISDFIQEQLCKKYNICGNQIKVKSFDGILFIDARAMIHPTKSKIDFKKYLLFVKSLLKCKKYNILFNLIKKEKDRNYSILLESICEFADFSDCEYVKESYPFFVLGYFDVLVDSKPFKVYAVLEVDCVEDYDTPSYSSDSDYIFNKVDCHILSVNKMPDKNEVFNLILKWVKSLNNLKITIDSTSGYYLPSYISDIPSADRLSKYFSKETLERFVEYIKETGIFKIENQYDLESKHIVLFFTYLEIGLLKLDYW